MKIRKILTLVLSAIVITTAGCTETGIDDSVSPPNQNLHEYTIAGLVGANSRTSLVTELYGYKVLWSATDSIGILPDGGTVAPFSLEKGENETNGIFKGNLSGAPTIFYGVYPYQTTASMSGTKLTLALPQTQTYVEGSFAKNMSPMVAKTTILENDTVKNMQFHEVCGVAVVQVLGSATLSSITFTTGNGEKAAGNISVDMSYTETPTVDISNLSAESVTLNLGTSGVALDNNKAKVFYLILPPQTYAKGYTLQFSDTNGGTMSVSPQMDLNISSAVVSQLGVSNYKTTDNETKEAYEKVSQFTARKFDGIKRADIFYEVFIRSFADSNGDGIGDFKGLTEKLDYLNEMGVSGIWLLPIHSSPSYHGYDVENYKDINPEYGTMADFEMFMEKAKSLNIKVILDFVINHTASTHPWFKKASKDILTSGKDYENGLYLFSKNPESDINAGRIEMTNNYNSNWHWVANADGTQSPYWYLGEFSYTMPDLNYGWSLECENSAAFDSITSAAKFWIDKGVSGFRLDAVKHIYNTTNTTDDNVRFLGKFYNELNTYYQQTHSDKLYMIGEMLDSYTAVAPYYGWDDDHRGIPALFDFSYWYQLKKALNWSDGMTPKWFPKDILEYQAAYKANRSDYIEGTKLANHDEDRALNDLGGNIEKAKMAAAVLLTTSGNPYIYYGEEIGMNGNKSGGDENVRYPMLWSASSTFNPTWYNSTFASTLTPVETQETDENSLWCVYRKFTELRNTYPALAYGEMYTDAQINSQEDCLMIFYRIYGSEKLMVIHNVSDYTKNYYLNQKITAPIADTKKVSISKIRTDSYKITMPPYSTIIIEMPL